MGSPIMRGNEFVGIYLEANDAGVAIFANFFSYLSTFEDIINADLRKDRNLKFFFRRKMQKAQSNGRH